MKRDSNGVPLPDNVWVRFEYDGCIIARNDQKKQSRETRIVSLKKETYFGVESPYLTKRKFGYTPAGRRYESSVHRNLNTGVKSVYITVFGDDGEHAKCRDILGETAKIKRTRPCSWITSFLRQGDLIQKSYTSG